MQFQILGSGTSQVSKERVSSSNYLEIANKKILIDCGCGTLVRLSQAGISVKDIDIVFITHFHIDHFVDLFSLIWALRFPPLGRKKKLQLLGPKGFKKFCQTSILPLVIKEPFTMFPIEVDEIEEHRDFDNFSVVVHNTLHTPESVAYKFSEKNKTIVISGDTGYDNKFIDFSKNADLLVLECSFDNKSKSNNHLTPRECGEIAKEASVKKLVLTHLYPLKKETRLIDTKKIFPKTILAKDLMKFNV